MTVKRKARIKICGITSSEDANKAVNAGANAIGLVFYANSPRYVTIEQAREIVAGLPPFISRVALFVNADTEYINTVIRKVDVDILQFHGDEKDEECGRYGKSYIKAIRMRENIDLNMESKRYTGASALLLDNFDDLQYGGTGRTFDWSLIREKFTKPMILAGGLTVENVGKAVRMAKPYAVDVSSGVEAGKGKKDADKIHAFICAVLNACD